MVGISAFIPDRFDEYCHYCCNSI